MNIAIIGCGLIGQKRARSIKQAGINSATRQYSPRTLEQLHLCRIAACVDLNLSRAESLAAHYPGCIASTNWQDVVTRNDIDIIIISTLHESLAQIGLAAIQANKHVIMEKPAGRHPLELVALLAACKNSTSIVRVGFNHRYHRAFRKARELVDNGALGELMFLRGRYGHGGRVGYEKEWRANPALSGGGELIDQGVHLIDLARWFLGDFNNITGLAHTYFWDMPVDDNGFLMLQTPQKQMAFLHASCTEWKNLFSFEIYGQIGKIDIQGLGGSYGIERMTFYKMAKEMGPPETISFEYPMADNSWEIEFLEFLEDIQLQRNPVPGLNDAYQALKIVDEVYKQSGMNFYGEMQKEKAVL